MSPALELPLFPLQTVLFPDNYLPLRIFEPRYLALIKRCVKDESGFGIIALKSGNEVIQEAESSTIELHSIGTLANVTKYEEVSPGILGIWTKGISKFRLETHWTEEDGLEIGQVRFLSSEPIVPIDPDQDRVALDTFFQLTGTTAEDTEVTADLSQNVVSNRLAHYMPFPLDVKQQILEFEDPSQRLDLIMNILSSS